MSHSSSNSTCWTRKSTPCARCRCAFFLTARCSRAAQAAADLNFFRYYSYSTKANKQTSRDVFLQYSYKKGEIEGEKTKTVCVCVLIYSRARVRGPEGAHAVLQTEIAGGLWCDRWPKGEALSDLSLPLSPHLLLCRGSGCCRGARRMGRPLNPQLHPKPARSPLCANFKQLKAFVVQKKNTNRGFWLIHQNTKLESKVIAVVTALLRAGEVHI